MCRRWGSHAHAHEGFASMAVKDNVTGWGGVGDFTGGAAALVEMRVEVGAAASAAAPLVPSVSICGGGDHTATTGTKNHKILF